MTPQEIISLAGSGGSVAILWILLTRVMDRLDKVTDKLIEIAENQRVIQQGMNTAQNWAGTRK